MPTALDQHPFPPPAVELIVEDPLLGTKVEAAAGDGDDHLAAHDLRSAAGFCCPLQVRVGGPVRSSWTRRRRSTAGVLSGAVVEVLAGRRVRRQFFEPHLVIVMQAAFVVVDEDAGRNVHR
jgi:hypothetical protein